MATDVWSNAVCIFFQGDRMNPILWAELDGQVEAMSSTFRISSSDPMRRRQAKGDLYSPCLIVRLTKIRERGSWTRIFKEVWQHKLMIKELGPFGPQHFDGLSGAQTFLRAGYNLDDPDFWGNVDHYVASTMKQSGCTSAPKKLAAKDPRAEEGMRRVAARLRTQLARMRTAQSNPLAEQTEAPEDRDNAGAEASGGSSRLGNARILDHDHVVWLGDTNSRLHWPGHGGMPLQQARQKVQQRRFGELLALDQLALMRRDRMAFHDFEEHPICFVPSYKWYPGVDAYDMRSQKHVPAGSPVVENSMIF
eukprot:symbB.v1.2.016367.t1/scaffold1243.1/size129491/9